MKFTPARLLDPDTQPVGGYWYLDPDTGYWTKERSLGNCIKQAKAHRIANGLPIAENFSVLVETQICSRSPGQCVNLDGSPEDMTCEHRGEEIRREGCDTCGGVQAKIMACALWAECTLFKYDVGVRACWNCKDRKSTLS
jgi:hypothetical protein